MGRYRCGHPFLVYSLSTVHFTLKASLTQILRKNNIVYLSTPDVSLDARLLSNARDEKKTFLLLRACTQKENLSSWATFFFFLFFILALRVLFSFFPAHDQANWNIKSAFMRRRNARFYYIARTKSASLSLSLSLCSKKASRTARTARRLCESSSSRSSRSGSILYESVI